MGLDQPTPPTILTSTTQLADLNQGWVLHPLSSWVLEVIQLSSWSKRRFSFFLKVYIGPPNSVDY